MYSSILHNVFNMVGIRSMIAMNYYWLSYSFFHLANTVNTSFMWGGFISEQSSCFYGDYVLLFIYKSQDMVLL